MSAGPNSDQRDFWAGPSGRDWIAHETAQDAFLSEISDIVLDHAGLAAGDRVLDIGCGTGALALRAAEVVGEDGAVLASDISQPLLDRASQRLGGYAHADTLLADAETADWPGPAFDHAISRLGVMFFNDPPRAFANIARALSPGGRMTFAAWGPADGNPYWSSAQRIAVRHLGRPPKVEPNTPGPMGLADGELAAERLRAAGLADVSVRPVEIALTFDNGADALSNLMLQIGPAARVARLFEATEAQRDAVRRDLSAWLAGFEDRGTVRLPALVNLIEARRP